jgi:hypothetical protein
MFSKIIVPKFNLKLLFIYLITFVAFLWFVASFSVNVPYWDQWSLVNLFEKVDIGEASFGDFFAQHNEHRIFFPKLIIVSLAFLSQWNIKYELYFSIFLASITFYALYKLSSLQVENKRDFSVQLTNMLTFILIFSVVQYENWLWGFQLAWFLTNTCLAIAVLLITLSNSSPKRLYFAAIPCFIASFSSAHGLLTWLAVIPSIASIKGSHRQRRIRIIIWILLFAGTCSVYFIDYQKQSHHPSILFFSKEPLVTVKYFFTLLGFPLAMGAFTSFAIGLIVFFIFLFLVFHVIRKSYYKSKLDLEATAWISIGLFALIFALVTTIGRAGFGVEQAMASRYTTSSVLLIISTAHLWQRFSWKNGFLAGIFTGLILINSVDVIPRAVVFQQQKQAGATCLELVNFIDESTDSCLGSLYPSTTQVRELAGILEKLSFRKFPKDITFITEPAKVYGYIDSPLTGETPFTLSQSGNLNAAGWAILPDNSELPKIVLFSYGSNKSFFANAVVNLDSPDVAKSLNSNRYNKVRWSANISPKSLPLGEAVIKAWVYDPSAKQLIKLNNELKVNVLK